MNESNPGELREIFGDAIGYWERRRIVYNAVLISVVAGWLICTWPHFREALTWSSLGKMLILGVIANLCYSAAYLADVPAQKSSFREVWQRRRWSLWLAG